MKIRLTSSIAALSVAFIASFAASAAEPNHCDEVANAVRAAIGKAPQKVLVIVEDAMVANEACAGQIVTAAITATHANPELTQQIVLTATHVAPKYADVITESAKAATAGGPTEVVATAEAAPSSSGGKDAANVEPVSPSGKGVSSVAPVAPVVTGGATGAATGAEGAGSTDFTAPSDIRGVYLIQPSTGGFSTANTSSTANQNCDCPTTGTSGGSSRTTVRNYNPQSPSTASHG